MDIFTKIINSEKSDNIHDESSRHNKRRHIQHAQVKQSKTNTRPEAFICKENKIRYGSFAYQRNYN